MLDTHTDFETVDEIRDLLPYLTGAERAEMERLMSLIPPPPWEPNPGKQTMAFYSDADIIGYGGGAGGGKTSLACGKAIVQHQKIMILRRVGSELTGIQDYLVEIFKDREGFNGKDNIWRRTRYDGKPLQVELGAVPNLGDEKKYQGRPHDLLVFDEAANFLEHQVRFLMGWIRSTDATQRCQALLCFNPPTSAEGRWIKDFFGPWINKRHPLYPTEFGKNRLAAMIPDGTGKTADVWVDRPDPFVIDEETKERVYDFDPADYEPEMIITPRTRTFIPALLKDNPYLLGTGYMSTVQALPEPLRSQMLLGDFEAGMEDSQWQVIPSRWVEIAQARWRAMDVKPPMDSMGVDVARGGKDSSIIARRHGFWFDELIAFSGADSNTGPKVAGQVVAAMRNGAPIHIDVIGVGASPYDFLVEARQQVVGVNCSEKTIDKDKSGRLGFSNQRSWMWWRMREILDPDANNGVALPPDPALEAELCAPNFTYKGDKIYVESREEIIDRIGRSPDRATAVCLAAIDTPKHNPATVVDQARVRRSYDPMAQYTEHAASRRAYNPLSKR